MKEKFRQTSFFSTFKRKLDIFKWQVKKSNREEPILLGIKSRRNNCEVPCDDFEYFDSRNNNCERIKHIAEKSPVVTPVVDSLHRRYKNKESEIEIFERKFLSSLVSCPTQYSPSDSLLSERPHCSRVTLNDGAGPGPGRVMTSSQPVFQPHHRVLRTSSKDSDCDSGAYSRSSSPDQSFDRLLVERPGEKKHEKSPLQSPNLVLSVIKESDRTSTLDKSKVDSNLLLSCLTEAGKSSVFSSLDNLNQISTSAPRYQRYYKKNQQRKPSMDSMVTLSGNFHHYWTSLNLSCDNLWEGHQTRLSIGRGCSKSETDLRRISDGPAPALVKIYKGSRRKYLRKERNISSESVSSIKICDCQVTVNGQHICNLIY